MCLPGKNWLDSYLREHRVQYWIKVWTQPKQILVDGCTITEDERGYATIYKASRFDFASSTFWDDILTVRFPDYPGGIGDKYRKLKRAATIERMEESPIPDRDKYIMRCAEKGIKQETIAEIFGVSRPRISQIIKGAKSILEDTGVSSL